MFSGVAVEGRFLDSSEEFTRSLRSLSAFLCFRLGRVRGNVYVVTELHVS